MSFRDNLKFELDYQNILVKELAERSGINKRTLDNYLREKATQPPVDIAYKIANVLGVSMEYLVTGKNRTKSEPSHFQTLEDQLLWQKFNSFTISDKNMLKLLINYIADRNSAS